MNPRSASTQTVRLKTCAPAPTSTIPERFHPIVSRSILSPVHIGAATKRISSSPEFISSPSRTKMSLRATLRSANSPGSESTESSDESSISSASITMESVRDLSCGTQRERSSATLSRSTQRRCTLREDMVSSSHLISAATPCGRPAVTSRSTKRECSPPSKLRAKSTT